LTPLSDAERIDLAKSMRATGEPQQLEQAFVILRDRARQDHAEACFILGEMYDPNDWSPSTSPFSKPNSDKAAEWYDCADRHGFALAASRVRQLPREERR